MTGEAVEVSNNVHGVAEKKTTSPFSVNVEVGGLPYIFRGVLPDASEDITLSLHVPEWEKYVPEIRGLIKEGKIFSGSHTGLFERDKGEIGFIHAVCSSSGEADVTIERIRSNTWIMPEGSGYHKASGVGRFLMNNFLALADARGWSIMAEPYTDGRLSDEDMLNWLTRKGFEETGAALARRPQSPDTSQIIFGLIEQQAKK